MAKDKKSTWVKSCKASSKKVMLLADELVGVEKLDEQTRTILNKVLRHLCKVRDGEKAAKELLQKVQERRSKNAKIWQLVQSSNAKAENLEHDFNEISAKIQELGL